MGLKIIGDGMESLNKFKILTIIFLCMFVFAVAAIYSNTKDVSEGKMKLKAEEQKDQLQDEMVSDMNNVSQNSDKVTDLETQLNYLNQRVDELSERINDQSSAGLNCKIVGAMTDNGVEQLTEETAVQEAKINNRELVITCSFQ